MWSRDGLRSEALATVSSPQSMSVYSLASKPGTVRAGHTLLYRQELSSAMLSNDDSGNCNALRSDDSDSSFVRKCKRTQSSSLAGMLTTQLSRCSPERGAAASGASSGSMRAGGRCSSEITEEWGARAASAEKILQRESLYSTYKMRSPRRATFLNVRSC